MPATLDRLFALETFGIKLGLHNITRLCEALGHPERQFRTLHVAGTNGKGSVTAMTHAALRAAGVHAARYISPHLADLSERFVIGDAPVDADALSAAADDVLACADRLRAEGTLASAPTFFEATTAVAFELFRRAGVEVAVIEVGLGGRFDATNVIAPVAGAITTIGLDHQQHLGPTREAIAFEKAGIIKPGMTVVVGDLPDDAMAVVRRVAEERGAPLVEASSGASVEAAMEEGRARVRMQTPSAAYGPLTLALRGDHQVANALVAVRLLEVARAGGIQVSRAAIETGLSQTEWPARLEELTVAGGKRLVLDAAHNPDGARALAAYLQRWHPAKPALVVSIMKDKQVDELLSELLPAVSAVIATQAPSPRALPAAELAQRIAEVRGSGGPGTVCVIADPDAAVDDALAHADTVCVAGSIFLVGAVRDGLRRRAILP